jgi:hypothetical protein
MTAYGNAAPAPASNGCALLRVLVAATLSKLLVFTDRRPGGARPAPPSGGPALTAPKRMI